MSFLAAFIHRQFIYEPPIPTASFAGKTVIVTGASSGLGLETCRWMVKLGASRVVLACRNINKGKDASKAIQTSTSCSADVLRVWHLDLGSYASVLEFADRVRMELPRLDVFVANAGIQTRKFNVTEDNEETITTNVVSMSLLATLLHPKLQETAARYQTQTHLTITGSELYEVAKFKERNVPTGHIFSTLNDRGKANMADRYNVSKLIAIFVVKEVSAASPVSSSGVIVNVIAPGLCESDLHRDQENAIARFLLKILARPAEVGARTIVHGASAGPEAHGQYVPDCKVTPTSGLCKGDEGIALQHKVWKELCQKLEAISPGVTSLRRT